MPTIFESIWINKIRKRYENLPEYQQPPMYRFAVYPEWEEKRILIEDLVSSFALEKQCEIVQRLRNPDLFLTTYNELIAGWVIKHCGYPIEYEKPLGGKTPDWYVFKTSEFRDFYVEVVTIMPPKQIQNEIRAWNEIRSRIQTIEHYFNLFIHARPTYAIIGKDSKAIVKFVQNWFDTFDFNHTPDCNDLVYKDEDIKITFSLIQRSNRDKCSVGVVGPIFSQRVDNKLLRRAISKKLAKYGIVKEEDIPFLIAIFPSFDSGLSIDSLIDVLFGKEQVVIPIGKINRDNSGMIVPRIRKGRPSTINTRMSAVMFFEQTDIKDFRIVHNPFAQIPISPKLFKGILQLVVNKKSEKSFELVWKKF